jgi:hypothetical protein
MDNATRRHWEQIADRCFDRAYATAQTAVTLLSATTTSAHYDGRYRHQDISTRVSGKN